MNASPGEVPAAHQAELMTKIDEMQVRDR